MISLGSNSRTYRWLALLATVCLLVIGGCSFDTDDEARGVDDAPDDLLETPTTETVPEAAEDEGFALSLMFVDGNNERVLVVRQHPTRPTVQDVLEGLAGTPTEKELEEHPVNPISTLLFASMNPIEQGTDGGQLRVLIEGEELREASAENPERVRVIYGQIVCSVNALEGNRAETVLIFDEEGAIPPVGEGATVLSGGGGPQDFRDCITAEQIAEAEAEAAAENAEGEEGEEEDGESTSTTGG